MNDSDTKEGKEQEPNDATQQERLSAIKTTVGVVRECLIKSGIPAKWGTLLAAILGAGMAVLISLASTGCHFSMKRDPQQGTIIIEGKRNVPEEGVE